VADQRPNHLLGPPSARLRAARQRRRDGRKSWIAMYRVNGKAVMQTFGTLAQIRKN
jgi:hypothetical protein